MHRLCRNFLISKYQIIPSFHLCWKLEVYKGAMLLPEALDVKFPSFFVYLINNHLRITKMRPTGDTQMTVVTWRSTHLASGAFVK